MTILSVILKESFAILSSINLLLQSQIYMQGIQDYINWLISLISQYTDHASEESKSIKKKMDEINERVSRIAKYIVGRI